MHNEENPNKQAESTPKSALTQRFRGFMPVVVDVETAGFNAQTDALLEIAFVPILMNDEGKLYQGDAFDAHLKPFDGANIEEAALKFTGIKLNSPLRQAIAEDEKTALRRIFKALKAIKNEYGCRQCILVGHNAHFDLGFLNAAIARTNSKNRSRLFMPLVCWTPQAYQRLLLVIPCLHAPAKWQVLTLTTTLHTAPFMTHKKQPSCFVIFLIICPCCPILKTTIR